MTASARTWEANVTYRECGVVTACRTYTVTLNRTHAGIAAEIDGTPSDLKTALQVLASATPAPVVVREVTL